MLDKTSMDATSTDEVNGAELLSFIERAERLHEERKAIASDISDIFAEAKGRGYDVKTLKAIIKDRALDPAQRTEAEILKDLYEAALSRART
ncbi:DUF2312 domain-containing protein [Castellaniella sp.]|uniref:DUF2312 domain-containing protein n=1 Tax=Castellaniella sp. TaxID=1955812 RepID=UPI002AFEA77B|nr:DUF2312 domain-containing protein [Castellaniella sp.]